jgi:hypothetical protein
MLQAIRCFLSRDHPQKELLIVNNGADSVLDLVPEDLRANSFELNPDRSGQLDVRFCSP